MIQTGYDGYEDDMRKIADIVHGHGAKLFVQLNHAGYKTNWKNGGDKFGVCEKKFLMTAHTGKQPKMISEKSLTLLPNPQRDAKLLVAMVWKSITRMASCLILSFRHTSTTGRMNMAETEGIISCVFNRKG